MMDAQEVGTCVGAPYKETKLASFVSSVGNGPAMPVKEKSLQNTAAPLLSVMAVSSSVTDNKIHGLREG